MNTISREAVQQERTQEAQLDEELVVAAEKAATIISQRDETIRQRDQRIRELESQDEELVGVVSQGSVARAERMSRKQNALEALRKAGVVIAVLLAIGLAYRYPPSWGDHTPARVVTTEAPPAGFLQRSAA